MRTFRLIEMTLLMVLCAVNFTACSDDDEPIVGTSQDLIGRWTLTWTKGWEFDSDGFKDTWDEADDGEDLIFKADGTGRMESQYGGSEYPFNWSFENNVFKWDYSLYNGCTTKIIQLDAEKLVFEITEYYDGEIDSQEINTYKRVSSAN